MKKIIQRQKLVHYSASLIGGFLAGYTVFNHMEIMGNAQTGNLIKMVLDLCRGDLTFIWFMVLSFLIYSSSSLP